MVWSSRANIERSYKTQDTSHKRTSANNKPDEQDQLLTNNYQLSTNIPDLNPPDSNKKDSIKLKYPIQQKDPYQPGTGAESPMYLKTPKNVKSEVEYDPSSNEYILRNRMNNLDYTPPDYIPFKDYMNYDIDQGLKNYWKERSEAQTMTAEKGIIPKIKISSEVFDKIFGGSTIDIRPQGSAELTFGVISNRRDDPVLNVKQRRITNFDFQEKIQMSVTAKIGDKINLGVNYNTEASFDFENKMKLAYEGKEDEIIKTIEAGNISMPLNTTLITGSQSLFGFKTKLQFGKVFVTGIFSEQQSKAETINVTGGAQVSNFILKADQYDENRHYLMAHYFRDNYEQGLSRLPLIVSKINITKIEVWISATNIGSLAIDNRNIIALSDLGEGVTKNLNNKSKVFVKGNSPYPDNNANNLYNIIPNLNDVTDVSNAGNYLKSNGYQPGTDYEFYVNARRLNPNEYTYNSKLGFISLTTQLLPNQALAVAFQYTVNGSTKVYQVGQFSDGGIASPKPLVVKLLKGVSPNNHYPIWNLMMKNVYSLGAYQVNKDKFLLNIFYTDDKIGVPTGFLNETRLKGIPLIKVMSLDKLDQQNNYSPDGVFDFIDNASFNGGTIQASNGRIYFPVLEPFGKIIRDSINKDGKNKTLADQYAYDSLYTMTKIGAQQYPEKNKFSIQGSYKSVGGSEISLNAMNIPQGSVKVTAGGIPLVENTDFTVDYALGRVKIINEGYLNSGTPIQISLENNSLFSIQKKTLMGTRVEYIANKDFKLGGTMLHLTERPLTQKISFGEEPISNTIWGMDVSYQKESSFITKMLDKLPFYNTKTVSHLQMSGEFANLIPGHSKAIGKAGTSYIDDFEGSSSGIDLKNQATWKMASIPDLQFDIFREAALSKNITIGFNRAKLAWYWIDNSFQLNNSLTPSYVDKNQQSNNYVREVLETEVFPNKQSPNGQPVTITTFDLSYYPSERGPYNFDVGPTAYSSGLKNDGTLNNPETRWAGITRNLNNTTDFETQNIEYIQFWMMDPFDKDAGGNHTGGELYFNLGEISEDVLKDGKQSFENGLPTTFPIPPNLVDTTLWGIVPKLPSLVPFFDNNNRDAQDVGLDGLSDAEEKTFYKALYLDKVKQQFGENSVPYINASNDPSGDDYLYFRSDEYNANHTPILDCYKNFNGTEGNSSTKQYKNAAISATNTPDNEDLNGDNTLTTDEKYFQYKIDMVPGKLKVGENFVTDDYVAHPPLKNGQTGTVHWYQFKIPIRSYDKVIGKIEDFKSIRFMRIFFKGFKDPVHCRFATMDLVRSEWRKYNYDMMSEGEYIPTDNNNTDFTLGAVNIEENGNMKPIPYVIPPGIKREINWGTTNLQQMNEQSLDFKVCNLIDGDARAVYKTSDIDVRKYKRIQMFVHLQKQNLSDVLNNGDLTAFIRLGTDFTDNYYEYELPLVVTPSTTDENVIWPDLNNFIIVLDKLVQAKEDRNIKMREKNSNVLINKPYIEIDGNNKITVVGLPNLASVKTIMIGVRNPKKKSLNPIDHDDGQPKCAEIWFDEFRLTDFNEKGGWAATGKISANLADLGNVTFAGNISTPNFGGIEQNINDRLKANVMQYNVATNLELGKFLPEKLGIKIPMHFDFSQSFSNPQYSPLNPDVLFKDELSTYNSKAQKDSIKKISQDYTMLKNLNFTNVKKVKSASSSSKPHIYDIENFDFSYAYSELFHRDADVAYDLEKKYKVGMGYNFVGNPKKIAPFSKFKVFSKTKYFALIKDFNFYYFPKVLTFRTDFDREFTENLLRNKTSYPIHLDTTYTKIYNWNRIYAVKWDLTQNLKFDYSAQALALIDEPPGAVTHYNRSDKDTIRKHIFDRGRISNFNQKISVNYVIPINKLPFLDWLSASATYSGEYHWTAAQPIALKDSIGNTIENGNSKQLNGTANFVTLYNKIPFLKSLLQSDKDKKKNAKTNPNAKYKNEGDTKYKKSDKAKKPTIGKDGKKIDKKDSVETPSINYLKIALNTSLRLLTSVKTISVSYQEMNGTFIPGFMKTPNALGQDWSSMAPGTGFIFGSQKNILNDAFSKGWEVNSNLLTTQYITKSSKNLAIRASLEPFPDMKIEVNATRNISSTTRENILYDSTYLKTGIPQNGKYYDEFSKIEMGTFTMSYFSWPTAFIRDNKDYSSKMFQQFIQYSYQVAFRLAKKKYGSFDKIVMSDSLTSIPDPNNNSKTIKVYYPEGYGITSQQVLLPAFLAAYTGRNPSKTMDLFPAIPFPNWRFTYTGLSKIDFLKQYFQSITIGHAYQSTYSIGNYTTNALFVQGQDVRDALRNFIPELDLGQITITEQFAPLINLDMVWVNSLMSKIEIRKSRNLALSFAGNQLTEIKSSEIVIGMGYKIKDVIFYVKGMNTGSKKKKLKSDINLKCDVSVRTNKTVLRKVVENTDQISAGQRVISINTSADYQMSDRFTIRAYFDKIITAPFVSSQFPNSNTNVGISLRFTLAQ